MSEPLRAALGLQLSVNRAHSAARAGDLDLAARLLDGIDAGQLEAGPGPAVGAMRSTAVDALDLRARVHAQRGELTEADDCWAKVQAVAPDDEDAAEGRRTIAEITAGRRRARPAFHTGRVAVTAAVLATAVAGVVLVGGATWFLSNDGGDRPSQPVAGADSNAQRLLEETRRADALKQRLASLEEHRTSAAAQRERELDAIAQGLEMPGVTVRRHAGDVQVVFRTGLFPYDAVISPAGASSLTEIGRRLAGMEVETTVVGHTVAVPGGAPTGGSVVALNRARVAAQYLAEDSELRLTDFRLVSADQRQGPFPDARRNRTVSLLIAPKEVPPSP